MTRRLLGALAAAAALVLATALPSAADTRGRIAQVEPTQTGVQILFAGDDLPTGVSLDPTSTTVTIDGQSVPSAGHAVADAPRTVTRSAMLLIDTSGSMKGSRLEGAQAAALAFLDSVPADVRVGLLTFGDTVRVVARPTTDRAAVAKTVAGLEATGGTRLYDAVTAGVAALGTSGSRTLVLLSDGADEGSRATIEQASAALARSHEQLQVVSLAGTDKELAPLVRLATAAKGQVVQTAHAKDLAALFAEAARAIANQVVIDVTVPPNFAGHSATVAVTVAAGPTRLADSAFLSLPAGAAQPTSTAVPSQWAPHTVEVSTGPSWLTERTLPIVLGGLFLGLAGLLALAVLGVTRKDSREARVRRRLSIYTLTGRRPTPKQEIETSLGTSQVARTAVELAGKVVAERDVEALLARRLDAAGLPLKPAEWILVHTGIALGLPLLLLLLTGGRFLVAALGLVLGAIVPWLYLSLKEQRRTAAFLAQLPDTLQLLAGSLAAGYSFPQAMDTVVREGQQPMTGEFNRALVEARLGVPVEDALESIGQRMKSVDFDWVVMAIRIQREVGGNLAEVLTTVANTLREREQVRRQVRVLSAEGRLSGWIIGGLPPAFAMFLVLFRPEYIKPLLTTSIGLSMIVAAIVLEVIGVVIIRQVVKVEV